MVCKTPFFGVFLNCLTDNKRFIAFFVRNRFAYGLRKTEGTFVFFAVLFPEIALPGVNICWELSAFLRISFFYRFP